MRKRNGSRKKKTKTTRYPPQYPSDPAILYKVLLLKIANIIPPKNQLPVHCSGLALISTAFCKSYYLTCNPGLA